MRAVDTNVIVHYLMRDDPEHAEKADGMLGRVPVFVPRTVVLEVEWVLRGVYGLKVAQIVGALRQVAGLPGVSVEDAAMVATAMDWAEAGMDFADALHLAAAGKCEGFVTFDKRFARVGSRITNVLVAAL